MQLSQEAREFAELLRTGEDPRDVALSVCLRLGIAREEAEKRVRDAESVFTEFTEPGEEDVLARFLDVSHVFVVDRELDAAEQEIRDLLRTALSAMGGIRSGFGHGLHRWLRTGELTRAYLSLARGNQVRATGDPAAYWSALVAAGELLPDGDEGGRMTQAREHCRQMTGRHPAPVDAEGQPKGPEQPERPDRP